MDPHHNYVSRSEIWRILEEVKRLQIADFENARRMDHRMDGIEQHLDEIVKVKSIWEPLSQCPTVVGDSTLHAPSDAFKGFEHGTASSARGLDGEEQPRRGASRANSVRFDKTANSGHYGHTSRSNYDTPLRPGSSMGGVALTDRSLSHRSDGGNSFLARTNSLGLDTNPLWAHYFDSWSPITPPPGFFVMGPVPSIIRCWLTTNYSSDTLLYAAVCSGSYSSSIGTVTLRKLGLKGLVEDEGFIKIPLYLPEARVHNPSVHMEGPQIPSVTIKFWIREENAEHDCIQIIIGSDVLRAHSADLLFSQDKLLMLDDDHQRITVPLVRPEKEDTFKFLSTGVDVTHPDFPSTPGVEREGKTEGVESPLSAPSKSSAVPESAQAPIDEAIKVPKQHLKGTVELAPINTAVSPPLVGPDFINKGLSGTAALWDAWNHPPKPDPKAVKLAPARAMKVLRPTKPNKSL
ncbi:hypothetical protein N7495_008705 [Penicillium taxi]|uniref:uncharacterized protein n=1 Tax=Penicillium taxi TaxID=168475 RepID=UPI00254596DA|nr:uncharacterized protein N7495_008705 [Penicillium taxi]KAJ5888664.1 hypothetical protein N7495_008705 [Penicillium taxi]